MKRISLLLLILALLLSACGTADPYDGTDVPEDTEEALETEAPIASQGDNGYGQEARQVLEALDEIGARWSGSAEEAQAAQLIVDTFGEMGYVPDLQPFTADDEEGETIESANVVAVKQGDAAGLIIVGAHYNSSTEGLGTDDNGSGVAALLEVAALVADQSTPYTIVFVAFGGEEAGLLGSTAYVGGMSSDEIDNTILFINLDSISAGDIVYVYSPESMDTRGRDWMLDWADSAGYDLQTVANVDLSQEGEETADYAAFQEAGIPWAYFEATNWELGNQDGYTQVDPQYGSQGAIIHTEYDTLEYLDETFPGRVDQHLDLIVTVLSTFLTEYQGN